MRSFRPYTFLLALGLALSGLAFLPSLAEAQADVITGRVTREGGAAISGARVEVLSVELETSRSVLTDGNGRFMILFPDGGGTYVLRVSFLGMADQVATLTREAGEELLVRDFLLMPQAIALAGITATVAGGTPGQGQAGEQSTELSQDLLNRLPLPDLDPATLALLTAGVTATELDSLSGRMGFSVGGMSDLLNEVSLDGILLGGGDLGVPEEGVRRTQVTTSTFDVSQGGFAGGLVSLTSARGSNRAGGAFTYRFDDDALQTQAPTSTGGFRRHNVGGSWGGPILPNRLFYNVSFQLQDNTNYRFALSADDPLAAARSGVVLDSVSRFLNILESGYGISTMGQTGSYNQGSGDLRLSGRVDWNISQGSTSSHSLTTRFNLNRADQDSTRISALDLSDRGGDTERNTQLVAATLNSRFRTNWTHRLSASYSENWNEAIPFVAMPEGRIRVTSDWEDGTRTARTLTFGGNRNMPTEARSEDLQISNELSFLQPIGAHLHRFKVGGSIQRQANEVRATDNLFGSFSYASLADFERNVPERYERSLTERESYTTRLNSGIFIGDTWRISQPLEVTLGLRWDHSSLGERPAYNPAVENTFGRRTDVQPSATGWSPRIGFSYRLGSGSGGSGASSPIPGMARSLTGGIGLFAGRAPDQVFSQAFRQTGLAEAEQSLVCVGSAVPIPNWDLYAMDPTAAPLVCADGGMGVPPVFSTRAPSVTLLNPSQRLPSSLRTDLGYRTFIMGRLPINLRYTWSLGMGLWGYEDLNLDESRTFVLGNDGRTFFGDPSGIVPATGATTLAGSRIHSEFGQVLDVVSDRRSSTHQLSAQVIGQIRSTTSLLAAYTLGFSRDQGSAGGGLARFGGGGGGLFAPGTGSPNEVSWATASGDRRHAINLSLSHAIRPEFEVSMLARITSGTPFTPLVDRDVNGDGLRNDIAFVFDPMRTMDPALAQGMARLLEQAPSRVADCITDQMGGFATRNSCRNGWSGSLDMRLGIRPNLPRLERRMTISVDATNVLTGVDQLVNGRENMRGWGAGANADPILLYVRGFNPATQSFNYEVNEAFGQDRRGVNALRAPFAIRLSARVALGGNPAQNNRGFGQTGGGGFGGMAAFLSGMGGGGGFGGGGGGGFGGGGGGGFITMFGDGGGFGGGGAGGGGMAALGALGPVIGSVLRGEAIEPAALVDALLPNPPRQILALRDSLALTEGQQEALAALGDELASQHAPRREAILPIARELVSSLGGGGAPNFAALQGLGPQIQILQPQVTEGVAETREILARVQEVLTEAQWEQVPPDVRGEAPAMGGGQGGGRGGQGRPGGAGGGAVGGFNAVGTLDRLLANPVPVVLEFADPVGMSDAQIQRIQGISAELDRTLRARREALGQRFDGVPAAEQIQVFQQIQPDIQRVREEIRTAMGQVREVLAPDQWNQLPAAVRNAGQQGGGVQIVRPGGGGDDETR